MPVATMTWGWKPVSEKKHTLNFHLDANSPNNIDDDIEYDAQWFRISWNRDVSTGPLACPLARSLAPLTHSLPSSWDSGIFLSGFSSVLNHCAEGQAVQGNERGTDDQSVRQIYTHLSLCTVSPLTAVKHHDQLTYVATSTWWKIVIWCSNNIWWYCNIQHNPGSFGPGINGKPPITVCLLRSQIFIAFCNAK